MLLSSCSNNQIPTIRYIYLYPPESVMTSCFIPEFTGNKWGDAGAYALALKRELKICHQRLDIIINWRKNTGKK